jgi:pantoate kinase
MEDPVVAWCPGHISGYFKPIYGKDLKKTGSLGAGFVIDEGVSAEVRTATATEVRVLRVNEEGQVIERSGRSPPIEYLADRLGVRAAIITTCRLPIAAGFGLSAAALIATATALNRLFSLGKSPQECALIAHESEILHHTGLGDVAACQGGGRDCRLGPGIGAEIIRHYDVTEPLATVTFGPLSSPQVLGSRQVMEQIAGIYPDRCPRDPPDLFRLSREFAERSGLITPEVRAALGRCDLAGVPASMTMIGNGVFGYGPRAAEILGPMGEVFLLRTSKGGVRICE